MERPIPTKQLLIELTGGNQGLISSAHHGLYETPLNGFYPHLDLDETIAFASSSWKSRERNFQEFIRFIQRPSHNIYDIFSKVYEIGFAWINKHKNISLELQTKYNKLNPFKGQNLAQRLSSVDPTTINKLKEQLQERVNEYIFECQYQEKKQLRGCNNYKLKIMRFQPVYPNKEIITPNFASEISRIIKSYSTKY